MKKIEQITDPDPIHSFRRGELGVHSPSSFKRSVNMMRRFNSYEEYLDSMRRMIEHINNIGEIFESMKIEPCEPNPLMEVIK